MYDVLFYTGMITAILAGLLFLAAVFMFFRFKIPALMKESKNALGKRQIEEIRSKSSAEVRHRNKVNVFEELEKNAKVKRSNTQNLRPHMPSASEQFNRPQTGGDSGTSVLKRPVNVGNPDFVIEKNIMFVSTSEVI